MSVYNGEKYLRAAIDSILRQTESRFEFIIVDDGSSDSSRQIIRSYKDPRIVLLIQDNAGLSIALNRGISRASFEYIARMDADDIAHPERLEEQLAFMEANPDCVVLGSNANYIDERGNFLYMSRCLTSWEDIRATLPASPFFHSATMFRRDAFQKVGGYYEGVRHFFEDQLLWMKLSKEGRLCNLARPLLDYRIVPTSITAEKSDIPRLNEIALAIIATGSISEEDARYLDDRNRRPRATHRKRYAHYYLRIGKIYLERRFDRVRAAQNLVRCLLLSPTEFRAAFNLFLCFAPLFMIRRWKAGRGVYDRER